MMDIAMDIGVALCVAIALVLAVLRIREQNRLKKATNRLARSYSEFGSVLDKVSDYIGIDDDKSPSPRANYRLTNHPAGFIRPFYRSDPSRRWHVANASRGRVRRFTCTVHQGPASIVPSADDLWIRADIDRTIAEKLLKESDPEATWTSQDESEFELALG